MDVSVQTHRVDVPTKDRQALIEKAQSTLERFAGSIQRVILRLTDENGTARQYGERMRCVAEVVLVDGRQVMVEKRHNEAGGAMFAAVQAARQSLSRSIGSRRGRDTFSP